MSIYDYWGKLNSESDAPQRHLLVYHCLDVAAVASEFVDQNSNLVRDISELLAVDSKSFFNFFIFLTALHDLGKFSSSFQALAPDNQTFNARVYDAQTARHDRLGAYLWDKFSVDFLDNIAPSFEDEDEALESLDLLATVVLGHHGYPITLDRPSSLKSFFESRNVDDARVFIDALCELFHPCLQPIPTIERLNHASWYLAALVTLSDWIGSNQKFFPFHSENISLADYWDVARKNAQRALVAVGLSEQAKPCAFHSVKHSFGFEPTPLQKWAQDVPLAQGPQLFILEDVTGSGKTEAALVLTHRLMAAGLADGFYFGLPTMATSNAMYERVMNHYQSMYEHDSSTVMPSVVLAQSSNRLSVTFQAAINNSDRQRDDYYKNDGTATAICNAWFSDSRKKSLLASIGVGTIDQALMAVLPQHHQSLRLFGLYRKVLIVDEVHAADAYMLTLLDRLIGMHLHHGGSVVLLTATLATSQRQRLVNGWLKAAQMSPYQLQHTGPADFPLATHVNVGTAPVVTETVLQAREGVSRCVRLVELNTQTQCVETIVDAVKQGQCVAWILNSVDDARLAYANVCDVLERRHIDNATPLLFHSRFTLSDRQAREKEVLGSFGKKDEDGELIGYEGRRGKILISTQVFQESLDADVDVMISDICPIDDLIQRAGRLHRHTRNLHGQCYAGPDQRSEPVLYLHAPRWEKEPSSDWLSRNFRNTEYVYRSPGRLWLGQRELIQQGKIDMPAQARVLIESVYNEKYQAMIPETLLKKEQDLIAEEILKGACATSRLIDFEYGYSANSQRHWFNDRAELSTRYSDRETVRVVVCERTCLNRLQPIVQFRDWSVALSTLSLDKTKFADHLHPISEQEQRELEKQYPDVKFLMAWCPQDDPKFGYNQIEGFFVR